MKPGGWLAVTPIIAAAWFAACDRPPPPRFPHLAHLELKCGGPGLPDCLTCASCHSSPSDSGKIQPLEVSDCDTCHKADASALLGQALSNASVAREPYRRVLFSHDDHLKLPKIHGQCVGCHAGVVDSTAASPGLPSMDTCLDCHQADFEQAKCTPCHSPESLRSLRPESFMRHDSGWIQAHGLSAARQQAICTQCHAETWCSDCHVQTRGMPIEKRQPERIDRRLVHRGDFVARHAIEARSDPATCLSCHSAQSCDGCHVQRGVSAARVGAVNPHPIGWMGRDTSSRNFHGRQARQDIVSCMACHDHGPATNCIQCHAVGGPGGRPHSPGFSSSRSRRDVPCRYCHVE